MAICGSSLTAAPRPWPAHMSEKHVVQKVRWCDGAGGRGSAGAMVLDKFQVPGRPTYCPPT